MVKLNIDKNKVFKNRIVNQEKALDLKTCNSLYFNNSGMKNTNENSDYFVPTLSVQNNFGQDVNASTPEYIRPSN